MTTQRLAEAVPRGLALFLLASALAKPFKPPTLCGPDPFGLPNLLMFLVEIPTAICLWRPGAGRRRAALFVALLMPAAAAYLIRMEALGKDVAGCGCFGPVRLPLGMHLLVQALVCAAAALTLLRERGRARGDAHSVRRLLHIFR
jgi:hypothetical protein